MSEVIVKELPIVKMDLNCFDGSSQPPIAFLQAPFLFRLKALSLKA